MANELTPPPTWLDRFLRSARQTRPYSVGDLPCFSATLKPLGRVPKDWKAEVKSYEVNITITSYGITTIEADSYEQALELAEELTAGDFDFIDGSDEEREVLEAEESK